MIRLCISDSERKGTPKSNDSVEHWRADGRTSHVADPVVPLGYPAEAEFCVSSSELPRSQCGQHLSTRWIWHRQFPHRAACRHSQAEPNSKSAGHPRRGPSQNSVQDRPAIGSQGHPDGCETRHEITLYIPLPAIANACIVNAPIRSASKRDSATDGRGDCQKYRVATSRNVPWCFFCGVADCAGACPAQHWRFGLAPVPAPIEGFESFGNAISAALILLSHHQHRQAGE